MKSIRNKKNDFYQLNQEDKQVIKKVEILLQAVEKVYPSTKGLVWRSFLQGVFVALGLTVGLSIVLGFATYLFAQFNILPQLNDFLNNVKIQSK